MKVINNVSLWLNEIRNGKLSEYDPINGTFHLGVAVVEFDWVDIELNIASASETEGDGYTDDMELNYFCCVKGIDKDGEEDWCDAGYLDDFGFDVDVDFSADNWEELLFNDMKEKLILYSNMFDIKYNEPNFDERKGKDRWNVFDRIYRGHTL